MRSPRRAGGVLILVAVMPLAACSSATRLNGLCSLVGTDSGVAVQVQALPAGVIGQVCLLAGACTQVPIAVPAEVPPHLLAMPDRPTSADVEVQLLGRPVERLHVLLRASYANGRRCPVSGYQGSVRLTAGPSVID